MHYAHRQLREVFHLHFLSQLLKISDPAHYVLKGGINLRFFFRSPRFSEDMDIDVLGGSVATLKKNGYKILDGAAIRRAMRSVGVTELLLSDRDKAKHTTTTQRFRLRLVTEANESLPTKVEFSRRGNEQDFIMEHIDRDLVLPYRQLSFPCQHYSANAAARQKIEALANRGRVQARDVFDLFILHLGGHDVSASVALNPHTREKALEQLFSLDFEDFSGQVLPFLEQRALDQFGREESWTQMREFVFRLLETRR